MKQKKIGEILKDNLQKKYFIFIYFLTVWIFKINFKIFIFSYKNYFYLHYFISTKQILKENYQTTSHCWLNPLLELVNWP